MDFEHYGWPWTQSIYLQISDGRVLGAHLECGDVPLQLPPHVGLFGDVLAVPRIVPPQHIRHILVDLQIDTGTGHVTTAQSLPCKQVL